MEVWRLFGNHLGAYAIAFEHIFLIIRSWKDKSMLLCNYEEIKMGVKVFNRA